MKKWTLSKWKKEAKKVFQRWVRLRDADEKGYVKCCTCEWKGKWNECDAGHFIPSVYLATCFEETNVNAQCKRCNAFLGGNGSAYFIYMEKKYGRKEIERLMGNKNKQIKLKAWDYQEIIDKYTDASIGLCKKKGIE